jgi:hypothetical protein
MHHAEILEAQRRFCARTGTSATPPVALDVIMGERAAEMKINAMRTIEDGRGLSIEVLVRKPQG